MGKSAKGHTKPNGTAPAATAPSATFAVPKDGFDPDLASLFASSSGPVTVPARVIREPMATSSRQADVDDETASDNAESEEQSADSDPEGQGPDQKASHEDTVEPPRKRRKVRDEDNLEKSYFERLERVEQRDKARKPVGVKAVGGDSSDEDEDEVEDELDQPGLEDIDDDDDDSDDDDDEKEDADPIPQHESMQKLASAEDAHIRTVFLGNVSVECIKTKSAKRSLTHKLRELAKGTTVLGKLESIRFRSTAYEANAGPKRATFAKKELMEATTKSTHAYAVFTTQAAAKVVAHKLNGTVLLDRHIRAEHLGSPTQTDHKRCIFIGNLSFVDEETADPSSGTSRPKAKEPADAEEGLWRVFGKVGPVEYVRVVRDEETRISKGFAYVQFKDENSVEKALLMNDKKFPPMLPRKLRVMRARKMRVKSTTPAAAMDKRGKPKHSGSRAGKSPRSLGGSRNGPLKPTTARAKGIIFEGHRATQLPKGAGKAAKPRERRPRGKMPTTRSSRRGAAFKAAGGKRKREAE